MKFFLKMITCVSILFSVMFFVAGIVIPALIDLALTNAGFGGETVFWTRIGVGMSLTVAVMFTVGEIAGRIVKR